MKQIIMAFCAIALSSSVMAQTNASTTATTVASTKKADDVIKFTDTKHNFGKIPQGVPVTYDFTFQNVSNEPLVIQSATASCGCTTPTWPQAPVTKNKKEKVSAGFNAAAPGPFEKTITVKLAGIELPVELRIAGEVLSKEDYAKYEATKDKKSGE